MKRIRRVRSIALVWVILNFAYCSDDPRPASGTHPPESTGESQSRGLCWRLLEGVRNGKIDAQSTQINWSFNLWRIRFTTTGVLQGIRTLQMDGDDETVEWTGKFIFTPLTLVIPEESGYGGEFLIRELLCSTSMLPSNTFQTDFQVLTDTDRLFFSTQSSKPVPRECYSLRPGDNAVKGCRRPRLE